MEVKDIVKPAVIVSEDDTFAHVLKVMSNEKTNTVLVVDEDGELSGEVTVSDLLNAIVPSSLDGDAVQAIFKNDEAIAEAVDAARELPVYDFMSNDYTALELNDDLLSILATAAAHSVARIPVINKENRPIGIISRQGLKAVLKNLLDK